MKKELVSLKDSLSSINVVFVFLLDTLFLLGAYIVVLLLSNNIKMHYAKVSGALNVATHVDLEASQVLASATRLLFFRIISYVVIGAVLIFILYVLIKGVIFRLIVGKKVRLAFIRKFAVFSLIWWAFFFLMHIFLLPLLLVLQQLGMRVLSIGFGFSVVIILIMSYFMLVSNLSFSRRAKFIALKDGFVNGGKVLVKSLPVFFVMFLLFLGGWFLWILSGIFVISTLVLYRKKSKYVVDMVHLSFPFVSLAVLILLLNIIWGGISYVLRTPENTYFIVLLLLVVLAFSWFKLYYSLISGRTGISKQ